MKTATGDSITDDGRARGLPPASEINPINGDDAMKNYTLICHVCRELHIERAQFLFSPTSLTKDGISYPTKSCGKHTNNEVSAAFFRLTAESGAR